MLGAAGQVLTPTPTPAPAPTPAYAYAEFLHNYERRKHQAR